MTFFKEVTYLDDECSHWVVDVLGHHEWDVINEDWISDRQVGWRSLDGLQNAGRVTFAPAGEASTRSAISPSRGARPNDGRTERIDGHDGAAGAYYQDDELG